MAVPAATRLFPGRNGIASRAPKKNSYSGSLSVRQAGYRKSLPSDTLATYRPAWLNCMIRLPCLANFAHRDDVLGFCSIPKNWRRRYVKPTVRKCFVFVNSTGTR